MTVSAPDLLATFPFPFSADSYRYSTNLAPAGTAVTTSTGQWGDRIVDVDSEYEAELAERAAILAVDPTRHAVLPHMRPAAWDTMLTLMRELATAHPESMSLDRNGATWHWRNSRLGVSQDFVYGDESTLPVEPLLYIAGQVQEDIVLLDQRGGELFVDAGVVTFAAAWSFGFDLGMEFLEVHGPVPRLRESGVITRARDFILRLQPNDAFRRTNWSMAIGRRLDLSLERYPEWAPDRDLAAAADDDEFGRLIHLRVEAQHLIRLPESGAVCFLIRTYMLPLCDLATVEPWRLRMAAVLAELPEDLADYKGITAYRDRVVQWLRSHGPS
ncbi:hypothetical protein TUM20985_18880 [Mycobacterium antarcticum]|uniref:heme-dependent oxidative N-demethylase family protein n=1 Tax=unclassified Mycolicibacterium TaxID=2636767 RepID=UPI002383300D|nr:MULTISPECIES: DUF3445 domain-containing protein [unclassified Mycolicibacterium]BDX31341.1 hypothetical protein TUM20985_18880 [Mycolicibacterium sp. TUM20985]GLP80489.1 hypothetical protein TUM20984_19090 [Mycolicibacterium sp. TUM20984]